MVFEQAAALGSRVIISDRAAGLRLGVVGDQPVEFPELPLAVNKKDPQYLPRPAVVHHDLDGARGSHISADLFQNALGMRRVVDYAEGIDQIVFVYWYIVAKLLGIRLKKLNCFLHSGHRGPLARNGE